MSDNETLAVYGTKARQYADLVKSEGRDKNLDAFIAMLPKGGHVLDWGCGVGNGAAAFREAGFEVTATDASPEFGAEAKRLFDLDIRIETFAELTDQHQFDGIWANFSLLHARKAAMPGHLGQAHAALKPGGALSLGLKLGEGEQRDTIGRFYAYYSEDEIKGLLTDTGFSVVDQSNGVTVGLDGVEWPWIVLRAHA